MAVLERADGRSPCGLAFVTGSAELVADVAPALEREGFATRSAAPHQLETIRAGVPARSVDCYVQLPTTDIDRDGLAPVAALRALVANALLARLDAIAVVARLLVPTGKLVIVAGDRAGTVRDTDLGLPDISGLLAEAVLANHGADKVQVTVIGDERSPADIAAIARGEAPRGRTTTPAPVAALAGYADVSPDLSFVEWRQEILSLATELDRGMPPRI